MKEVQDFIFAKKTIKGVFMYVDEACMKPYLNSMVQPFVDNLLKDAEEGTVEMVCL